MTEAGARRRIPSSRANRYKVTGRERGLLASTKQHVNVNMRIPRTGITLAYAFALVLLGAAAAHAASREDEEHACRGDALRLCMADVPDKARITECMKQHYDQLSAPCRAMFDAPRGHGRAKGSSPANGGQ